MKITPDLPLLETLAARRPGESPLSFEVTLDLAASVRVRSNSRAFGFDELGVLGVNSRAVEPETLDIKLPQKVAPTGDFLAPVAEAESRRPPNFGGRPATEIPAWTRGPTIARSDQGVRAQEASVAATSSVTPFTPEVSGGSPADLPEPIDKQDRAAARFKAPPRPPASDVSVSVARVATGLAVYVAARGLTDAAATELVAKVDEITRTGGELLSDFTLNGADHTRPLKPGRRT